jgi:hypothetical protein
LTTLTDPQAHAQYVAECLAPEKVRHGALSALLGQVAPETLRTGAVAASPDLAPVWLAWADEAEALATCGISGQSPRDAAKLALVTGGTAAQFRSPRAYPGQPARRRRVRRIADEMDLLLAEGFDPEVYAKEIDQALGGSR